MKARNVYAVVFGSFAAALLVGSAGAHDTSPEPEEEESEAIALCGPPSSLLIDDLDDGDTVTADGLGSWYFAPNALTPSALSGLPVPGGPGRSCFAAHLVGPGTANSDTWLGVSLGCARDVRRLDGFRFAIKGTGAFYAKVVTLDTTAEEFGGTCVEADSDPDTTNCNDHYSTQETFTLPDGRWYECSVRFRDLDQLTWGTRVDFDPREVTGVEFIMPGEVGFDLMVDDVRFAADVHRTGCRPLQPRHRPRHHGR